MLECSHGRAVLGREKEDKIILHFTKRARSDLSPSGLLHGKS